jgi:hypothetical protein
LEKEMKISGKRLALTGLLAVAGIGLSACAYDDYGYGGISAGYGGGYYDDYYPGYAGYGWYDGFYYPGNGYYVYDRGGKRHRWNDRQRRYWEGRHHQGAGRPDGNWHNRPDRPHRPDRPSRAERQERRDAARGKGIWGAVPRETRPSTRAPRAAPSRSAVTPRATPAPRATAPRSRPSSEGRGGWREGRGSRK